MIHKLATVFSISLLIYSGIQTISYRNVSGKFFEFYGKSAVVYGSGLVILAIIWLICWHTKAFKFTRDDNWPYLLLSNYLIAIIVKMIM